MKNSMNIKSEQCERISGVYKWNMLNPLNLTSEIDQKIYLVNLSIY